MSDKNVTTEKATESQTVEAAEVKKQQQNRKAPTPRRVRPQLSRPAFRRTLKLNSLQAQKVINRSFNRVSNSLYSIDVILQIIGERDQVDQAEADISALFEKISDDLLIDIAQARELIATNGIDEMPEYTDPKEYPIEITSPQIAEFARLLSQLDELMLLVDTLWLNAAFTNRQRKNANYDWQQRLVKLAGRIIGLEKRARIAAYNKGKKDEVDLIAPEIETEDAEIAAASEEEHGDTKD